MGWYPIECEHGHDLCPICDKDVAMVTPRGADPRVPDVRGLSLPAAAVTGKTAAMFSAAIRAVAEGRTVHIVSYRSDPVILRPSPLALEYQPMNETTQTTQMDTQEIIEQSAADLRQRAMLVKLSATMPRSRMPDLAATEELHESKGAERSAGSYSKRLYDKQSLERLSTAATALRKAIDRWSSPWAADGIRIMAAASYEPMLTEITSLKRDWENAKISVIAEHDHIVARQTDRLSELFNVNDYPTKEQLASQLWCDVEFYPMPVAGDWRLDMTPDVLESLVESTKRATERMMKDSVQRAFNRLYPVVNRLAERLASYEPGNDDTRATPLYESLIGNARDLCDILPGLNFTDDPELAAACERLATAVPADVTIKDLRGDAGLRRQIAADAAKLRSDLQPHADAEIVERATRETAPKTAKPEQDHPAPEQDDDGVLAKADAIF